MAAQACLRGMAPVCRFMSESSIPFIPIICYFITIALKYNLKSGIVRPTAVLLLFWNVLALQCFLYLHMKLRMVCKRYGKGYVEILKPIALNL